MFKRDVVNALEHSHFMKYVYGVIRTDKPLEFDVGTVGGVGLVQTAVMGGLALLVSSVSETKIRPSRRNMLAHTKALEAIMQDHDVLPMRFGLVIDDVEAAKTLLTKYADVLHDHLDKVSGHIEFGVKATWEESQVFAAIMEERADIRELRDSLAQRSPDQTYYERIEIGRQLEAAVAEKNSDLSNKAHAVLAALATDSVLNTAKDQMTAIDAAYLVDRKALGDFEAKLNEAFDHLGDMLTIKLVGPVPPFNFVNLSIDWSR